MNKRIGYYCWSGPGTIRMTNLKYFDPQIDVDSMVGSYEYEYIKEVQEKLGVTDYWVTYSWGFGDEIEQEDREFILERLKNFKKLSIKTHAYIQGPNLVYDDFKDRDWWARDNKNNLIPYHRGRKVICVNNPDFQKYFLAKIEKACQEDFDGIFVDNIQMGSFGIPGTKDDPQYFYGCSCEYCKQKFKNQYNLEIPEDFRDFDNHEIYQKFRTKSVSEFLRSIAKITRKYKKEFGTNSFDPKHDSKYTYGTNMKELSEIQDYILFENHPLSYESIDNSYIEEFIKEQKIEKPVFVVSYRKGIGFDEQYSQKDIDNILSESKNSEFNACVKGSEFITNNEWHNLRIDKLRKANTDIVIKRSDNKKKLKSSNFFTNTFIFPNINWIITMYFENKIVRKLLDPIYKLVV